VIIYVSLTNDSARKDIVFRTKRELKKTTTATAAAAGTSLNKMFNEQNNGWARAL